MLRCDAGELARSRFLRGGLALKCEELTAQIVGSRTSFRAGFDRGADTDDEDDELDPGRRHESKLGELYNEASRPSGSSRTTFTVLLHGERYTMCVSLLFGSVGAFDALATAPASMC